MELPDDIIQHIIDWKEVKDTTIIASLARAKMLRAQIIYSTRYTKISSLIYQASDKKRRRILLNQLPWLLRKKLRLDKLVEFNNKAQLGNTRALERVA